MVRVVLEVVRVMGEDEGVTAYLNKIAPHILLAVDKLTGELLLHCKFLIL